MICEHEFRKHKHVLTLYGVPSSSVGGRRGGSGGTPLSLSVGLIGGVYSVGSWAEKETWRGGGADMVGD